MLLFSGLTNMRAPAGPDAYTDIRLLEGIYLGLLLLITVPSLLVGLRSGANLFTLSDVNNLFISPVSPRKILLYGLLRQMGASLLMMVFFFSYAGMAVRSFGLTPLMAVLLIAGFAVTVFLVQLLTMLIYSFSNGSPARIRGVKTVLILLVGAALAAVGVPLLQNGLGPDSLYAAVSPATARVDPLCRLDEGPPLLALGGTDAVGRGIRRPAFGRDGGGRRAVPAHRAGLLRGRAPERRNHL